MGTIQLRECKTAAEVIANIKAVKARIKLWKPVPDPAEQRPRVEQRPIVEMPQISTWCPVYIAKPDTVVLVEPEDPEPPPRPAPTMLDIKKAVASYFSISIFELVAHRHDAKLVRMRQIAMYLAKKLTARSLPQIGRHFDGRDHTTVMHAIRKIERLRPTDDVLNEQIRALEGALQP